MANPWFRAYAEFATDAKVQSMSEAMQRRLMMVFCLRSCDVLVTLSDDELAFQMRITGQELEETKALFIKKRFINDDWGVTNWDKRQFVSDSSSHRTAAYRERKKNAAVTAKERHSDALDTDTDTDTDTEKKESKSKTTALATPSASLDVLDGIPAQLAADFKALRKLKKAPITQTAIDGIKREAAKAGVTLETALSMCCERGWSGFKADWAGTQGGQGRGAAPVDVESTRRAANEEAKRRLFGNKNMEVFDV